MSTDPRSEFGKRAEIIAKSIYVTRGVLLKEIGKIAPTDTSSKLCTKDVHLAMDRMCESLSGLFNYVDSSRSPQDWKSMLLNIGKRLAEQREALGGKGASYVSPTTEPDLSESS